MKRIRSIPGGNVNVLAGVRQLRGLIGYGRGGRSRAAVNNSLAIVPVQFTTFTGAQARGRTPVGSKCSSGAIIRKLSVILGTVALGSRSVIGGVSERQHNMPLLVF